MDLAAGRVSRPLVAGEDPVERYEREERQARQRAASERVAHHVERLIASASRPRMVRVQPVIRRVQPSAGRPRRQRVARRVVASRDGPSSEPPDEPDVTRLRAIAFACGMNISPLVATELDRLPRPS